MIRTLATTALLLASTGIATANDLETAIDQFLAPPGYERVDIEALEQSLQDYWLDTTTISPGGAVGPIEKALLIGTGAIPSERTRTALAYGELHDEQHGRLSFIELRHYNMGPAIRDMAIEAYGADSTADASEFGEGEHLGWRFVFMPLMGNTAVLVDAARTVIDPDIAYDQDCTGRPCMNLDYPFDSIADWEETDTSAPHWPRQYPESDGLIATPAHAAAELAVIGWSANVESDAYQWTGGERPESADYFHPWRFIGIDRNLGQEAAIDAVWQETQLMDDSLSAMAFRRLELPGATYWFGAATPR